MGYVNVEPGTGPFCSAAAIIRQSDRRHRAQIERFNEIILQCAKVVRTRCPPDGHPPHNVDMDRVCFDSARINVLIQGKNVSWIRNKGQSPSCQLVIVIECPLKRAKYENMPLARFK